MASSITEWQPSALGPEPAVEGVTPARKPQPRTGFAQQPPTHQRPGGAKGTDDDDDNDGGRLQKRETAPQEGAVEARGPETLGLGAGQGRYTEVRDTSNRAASRRRRGGVGHGSRIGATRRTGRGEGGSAKVGAAVCAAHRHVAPDVGRRPHGKLPEGIEQDICRSGLIPSRRVPFLVERQTIVSIPTGRPRELVTDRGHSRLGSRGK